MGQNNNIKNKLQLGTDKGLIKMYLDMSPEERIRANDNSIRTLVELRNAFKKQKNPGPRLGYSA